MSRSLKALGLVMPFVFAMSCGGGYTKGTFCSDFGSALCHREVECQLDSSLSACESDFHTACCGSDGTCGDKPASAADESAAKAFVADCSAALDNYDCYSLSQGSLPYACAGYAASAAIVPEHQSPSPARQSTLLVPQAKLPAATAGTARKLDPRAFGRQAASIAAPLMSIHDAE